MANLFSFISGKKTKESTPFNVTATDAFLQTQNYKEFCQAAYNAYDTENYKFFEELSDDELIVLYASCYIHEQYPLTRAYDDEVIEALCQRKNRDQLINAANVLIFRNLSDAIIQDSYEKHFRDPGEGITIDEKRQRIIDKVNM